MHESTWIELDVVKQEMERLNIDILGISELKWMEMGKFNSDKHYIYYCGQESSKRNAVALIVNKRLQNAVLGWDLKNNRMISVHFQGKPFNITLTQVYTPITNAKEADIERFSWRPIKPSRTNNKKDVLFIILQTWILEQVAFPFFRGSSQPRDRIQVFCITGGFFTSWATRKAQEYWSG